MKESLSNDTRSDLYNQLYAIIGNKTQVEKCIEIFEKNESKKIKIRAVSIDNSIKFEYETNIIPQVNDYLSLSDNRLFKVSKRLLPTKGDDFIVITGEIK